MTPPSLSVGAALPTSGSLRQCYLSMGSILKLLTDTALIGVKVL
jgi:hypothetical protein